VSGAGHGPLAAGILVLAGRDKDSISYVLFALSVEKPRAGLRAPKRYVGTMSVKADNIDKENAGKAKLKRKLKASAALPPSS